MKTQGLGERHVACQAGWNSEILGPAPPAPPPLWQGPWLASASSCKGEASVSFPDPRREQVGPHPTSQPRESSVYSELSLGDAECYLWACSLLEAHPESHFMG